MKQYKLLIAYDGTGFCGWLQQEDQPSIVQTLEQSFERAFGRHITLLGASKTDAGVHALGQVAVFKTDLPIDDEKMRWVWNNALPPSILIRSLAHDEQFHPHYNVMSKTYYYHIFVERPLPFVARYGLHYAQQFDADIVRKTLHLFKGTHDFHAFYTGTDRGEQTIRTIEDIDLEYLARYRVYRVSVTGPRFLRHMIRRIVGAALAVNAGKVTHSDILHALQTRTVIHTLPTAPAQGLMLYRIIYDNSAKVGKNHE